MSGIAPAPRIVDANGSSLTLTIVRFALIGLGRKPEQVMMHPAQKAWITNCAFVCANVIDDVKADVDSQDFEAIHRFLRTHQDITVAGIPIAERDNFPLDVIEFRDSTGAISVIKNLWTPKHE